MSSVDDVPPVPKVEPFDEDDFSDDSQEPDGLNHAQEIAQVQKRKGGRKPIYATSEERKQRNRQAQAAFRERRTEYIKQLETTITQHEETLQSLQQSHRSAADECLMLRYKNSLLERILLEKGIDVQAELRMKTEGSHVLSQPASTAAAAQPSAVQRAVMNRHNQARRTTSASSGKPLRPQHNNQNPPPRSHSMTSHVNSPIVMKSPYGSGKSGMMPDGKAQSRHQQSLQPRTHPPPNVNQPRMPPTGASLQAITPSTADSSRSSDVGSNPVSQAGFYPSPYQAHLEQLEQEYDAHADLLDDENPSDNSNGPASASGPGPYPQSYQQHQIPPGTAIPMGVQGQQSMQPAHQMPQMQPTQATSQPVDPNNPMYGVMNPGFDPYDPSLDADPFGLTASMHFPTQFTYHEGHLRR